jgi:hypothetical protein
MDCIDITCCDIGVTLPPQPQFGENAGGVKIIAFSSYFIIAHLLCLKWSMFWHSDSQIYDRECTMGCL